MFGLPVLCFVVVLLLTAGWLASPAWAQDTETPAAHVESTTDAGTGDNSASDLAEGLKNGDMSVVADKGWVLLVDYGPYLLGKLVGAVVVVVIGLILARILAGMTRKALGRAKIDETLARFFSRLVRYLVLVVVALVVLNIFGIEVTAFAAILAAAGFAIGMALSGTLGNFAAGVMLLIFRPFKVGDVINAAGVVGKVDEIELFTTAMNTPDNRRIIVPNGEIFGSTIENITFFTTRRVDLTVGVSYDADIDSTKAVLQEAIDVTEGILDDPATQIYLNELGASSVDYVLRIWTAAPDYWSVREKLMRNVKYKLDGAGIGIPYPQMDVHYRELRG